MSKRGRLIIAGSMCLSIVIAACSSEEPSGQGLVVVATTSIVGDIASGIVGEQGEVEVLIPVGADAHDFAPSAQQVSLISTADLVVANGLGLESGLGDVLASALDDGVTVIELAPLVDPLPFSSPEHTEDEEGEHEDLDPHFWMDPVRVGQAAVALGEAMTELAPDGDWQGNAADYAAEMSSAHASRGDLLDGIGPDRRQIITNHESFGYFAERYGFEILGVVIPGGSTLAEPSSAHLAELIGLMRETGARVVFAETSQPTTLAEAVAAEIGDEVQVVELYTESLGEAGSGAESLSGMLVTNAELIVSALGQPGLASSRWIG
ncbi:MAG TPA: metal ABC transporter substrate-binding protein [Acidimicrobiia bacterium]|nr:metal ABC transporter substrate-binding protein [Acidimicrobiia bacterium]